MTMHCDFGDGREKERERVKMTHITHFTLVPAAGQQGQHLLSRRRQIKVIALIVCEVIPAQSLSTIIPVVERVKEGEEG